MADIYTQFSEGLTVTKRDIKWIKEKIAYFENPPDPDGDPDKWKEFLAECEAYDLMDPEERESGLEFEVQYFETQVIFYSEDQGDPWHVATLVQNLFRKYYPDACFTLNWAGTCSKPRAGEFDGGGLFVTATDIEHLNVAEWLHKKVKEFGGKER